MGVIKVNIDGTATITVWVGFHIGREKIWVPDYKTAKLKCLVGRRNQSQHNAYYDVV